MIPAVPSRLRTRGLLAVVTPLLLAACSQGAYTPPTPDLAGSFRAQAPARTADAQWWSSFQDRQLDDLIQTGLNRNLDIQAAVALIRTAEANARAAGADAWPTATLGGRAQRGDPEGTGLANSTSATLSASWVIDIFGANRANRTAAAAERDAAHLSAQDARITVAGAIATAYIDLRFYQNSLALARQNIATRREALALTQSRSELGVAGGRLAEVQALQAVAEVEATLPGLEIRFDEALNRLATLTAGRSADLARGLVAGAPQPAPRFKASVGLPAEVIRNRPDVRRAERQLAAATARIGVAQAAFYPSVSLGGTITPTDLGAAGNLTTWSFGPQINLPLFTGGANQARLSAAEAAAQQAHVTWQATVLGAVEEVENALAAYNRDGRAIAAQLTRIDAATTTLALARDGYELGSADFLSVLDAQRAVFDARSALAEALRQRALTYVRTSVAAAAR